MEEGGDVDVDVDRRDGDDYEGDQHHEDGGLDVHQLILIMASHPIISINFLHRTHSTLGDADIASAYLIVGSVYYIVLTHPSMRQHFLLVLTLFCLSTNCLSTLEEDTCFCLNEGTCKMDEAGISHCQCPQDAIGTLCEEAATSLTKLQPPANITDEYAYFFIEFNTSTLFYVQIYFCPLQSDPSALLQVQIDFQDENGALAQLSNSKNHSLRLRENQCAIAKYVILPYKKKANGQFIRLLVRIRKIPNKSMEGKADRNYTGGASPLNITYNAYEFYRMSGENIGELMVVSTLSSMLLICISFAICRKIFLRRGPRFVYQPAVMVRDISSFDDFMPAAVYPLDPSIRQEDKECMICLLNVENTLTRNTPCGHLFHKECIDEWGRKSLTCPMCRLPLERDQRGSRDQSAVMA